MSGLPDCPKCGSKYVYEDGNMIVCPECAHEWTSGAEATSDSDVKIVKDSNGNVLSDGDSVTIIRTLKSREALRFSRSGQRLRIYVL